MSAEDDKARDTSVGLVFPSYKEFGKEIAINTTYTEADMEMTEVILSATDLHLHKPDNERSRAMAVMDMKLEAGLAIRTKVLGYEVMIVPIDKDELPNEGGEEAGEVPPSDDGDPSGDREPRVPVQPHDSAHAVLGRLGSTELYKVIPSR